MNKKILENIVNILKNNKKAALITLCQTSGSTPRKAGAKMLVFPNGKTIGTIGGGQLEYLAVQKAREVIDKKKPILFERDLVDEGMICGGNGVIYIEFIGRL
ncbi:XdhC and CoxI family protein [Desulfotomaculum arcticum]|uniref:XdhC and CoxI family protein n=1 Tax=Desulfotruncus arcticus DSM 17038 TaxID=1121424 RepID=A0A1I2S3H7_9FIRM|nr:XdhC family protein [Desulfotruncus arcticus]SFG47358.1 XdhC and CoxI family protein [Desulfotomaculum arcticum] [Desulfotruncus arcticus DSM 17038]